jgi:predicted esterase
LEAFGGFHNLPVNCEARFPSSLGIGGFVQWSTLDDVLSDETGGGGPSVELDIAFPGVDWAFQQSVYGWAALQYQAFTRGFITVGADWSCKIILHTDNVLELSVNGKVLFGGDFYGFRRAPLVLELAPGRNKIDIRLIRDVRSMGGLGSPSIPVRLAVQRCTALLFVVERSVLLPDVIHGKLTTPYASVVLCNATESSICVVAVQSRNVSASPLIMLMQSIDITKDSPKVQLLNDPPISLIPGQSRPINLYFSTRSVDAKDGMSIAFVYGVGSHPTEQSEQMTSFIQLNFSQRSIQEAHKFTFLHPSKTVSYAVLRPPAHPGIVAKLPVLINLHGAGLDSDSHQVRHMLDAVPGLNAWVLFPTGMSPWSGDDWHVWGLADVMAAVLAISDWMNNMNWIGPGIDQESWIVTGHSNGGQGAWFISTHHPDRVIATAAASGYSSIQNYVPYVMWREVNAMAESIVQHALSSYRHELLIENMAGISIYQQHGGKDDNVPPYHSRLLHSLIQESVCSSQYVELPDRGHWFDGAMTTIPLRAFYTSVLECAASPKQIPTDFNFVVPNSGDIGSMAGISVDQLQSPDYMGRVGVSRVDEERSWNIGTSNIRRIHFDFRVSGLQKPKTILLDRDLIHVPSKSDPKEELALVNSGDKWHVCGARSWKGLSTRHGRQRGSLDAILRTLSSFRIRACSNEVQEAALQVSRNLMQYYRADSEIGTSEQHDGVSIAGNVITLAVGKAPPSALLQNFPVQICEGSIDLRRPNTNVLKRIPSQPGLGMAFLRPLLDENLELVLWGFDSVGLEQAMRMVPTLSGAGQPDFVVLGNDARWKGVAGVLAMGFFDHAWEISQSSYLP